MTASSSNASSGIESMDERSELDLLCEDRRKVSHTELLEALDTLITKNRIKYNEPFGKYPISVILVFILQAVGRQYRKKRAVLTSTQLWSSKKIEFPWT